jgi:ABC-type Fe3+-hydroxamate transport system substrate-binding protein
MNTKIIFGIALIAIIAVGSGWYLYSADSPIDETPKTKTVVDSRGQSVTIPADVQRVIALRSGII